MEEQLEEIREQQKSSWNQSSPGWKKWDELFMDFLRPNGAEIIRSLKLKSRDTVLDVVAGTGEPRLQGNLYVVDDGRISKITQQGLVSTIAGSTHGYKDGPGTEALFDLPVGITIDHLGTIYVADAFNSRIRKITFEQPPGKSDL